MIDREKIIKEAEEILSHVLPDDKDTSGIMVKVGWLRDTNDMLKEQEEQIDTQRRNLMILLNEPRIVRCKDCEHATITTDGEYCKYCENYTDENGDPIEVYHSADWFCADGRKRDD